MSDTPLFDTLNKSSLFLVTEPIEIVTVVDDDPIEPDLEPDADEPAYAEAPADAPGADDDIPLVEDEPVEVFTDVTAEDPFAQVVERDEDIVVATVEEPVTEFRFPEVVETVAAVAEVPEFTLDVPPADAGEIEVETEEGAEHDPIAADPDAPFLPSFDDAPLDPNFDPDYVEPTEIDGESATDEEIAKQTPWG